MALQAYSLLVPVLDLKVWTALTVVTDSFLSHWQDSSHVKTQWATQCLAGWQQPQAEAAEVEGLAQQ